MFEGLFKRVVGSLRREQPDQPLPPAVAESIREAYNTSAITGMLAEYGEMRLDGGRAEEIDQFWERVADLPPIKQGLLRKGINDFEVRLDELLEQGRKGTQDN